MIRRILVTATMGVVAVSANAATIGVNYTSGYHVEGWVTAGSNGATVNQVYGDGPYGGAGSGANYGIAPADKCADGNVPTISGNVQRFCNDYNRASLLTQNIGYFGGGTGNGVVGDNGQYWNNGLANPNTALITPTANYAGSLSYDDSATYCYTDKSNGQNTCGWYRLNGGTLAWTGTVGFEVVVNPSATSGSIGGSFFGYDWTNSFVDLVTGARGTGSHCELGFAGSVIVGTILCGAANPASGFAYTSTGTYVNTGWSLIKDNGNGTFTLMLSSNRRTVTGNGNDLQETLVLSTIPVPGAVWLFGSAVGLLGWARRKAA